jgi:hypothetical protein
MNKLILVLACFVVVSCDPPNVLIVENTTNDILEFSVTTIKPITFESIYVSDSLIPDEMIHLNSIPKYFNKTLKINQRDSLNYYFSLSPNGEVLISPSTIAVPFKTVTYKQNGLEKTILGEEPTSNLDIEVKHKPIKITIVKIN